jgi:peptidoglycan-N-acetylglucosamine deacetylase
LIHTVDYTIKAGDTINKITNKYDIKINEFIKYNSIEDLVLLSGQVVFIPLSYDKSLTLFQYKICENDTFNNLSKKFNVNLHEIKYFNNIYDCILEEKQVVKLNHHTKDVSPIIVDFDYI